MATAFAFDVASKRISTLDVDAGATAACVDLLTDTLFSTANTAVIPLFQGARMTGVHRTGKIVNNAFPRMAWLRLAGPFTSAVVRIYRDGVLFYTSPTITSENPVRLPAGMARAIEIEVESSSRITALVMASSTHELQAT